jgi:hypothetical protein
LVLLVVAAAGEEASVASSLRGTGAGVSGTASAHVDSQVAVASATSAESLVAPEGSVLTHDGKLLEDFVLSKRFDFSLPPEAEFDVEVHSDEFLTHSCSNYTHDGKTVRTENNKLHLRVDSACKGGDCLNSGRIMSKESFKYGLFTFSAKVPKCNYVWPALWLLPQDVNGTGSYGRWPCSGEIDVLETVHDQSFGTFNLVAGYGSTGGCFPQAQTSCNECQPEYCTSTTMDWRNDKDRYFVEQTNCDADHPSWEEHLFVLNWQQNELTTWIDPTLSYDAAGRLISVEPKPQSEVTLGLPTWRTYVRQGTPTWLAVENFMKECFHDQATPDAPFDDGFKIVINIAVGGYGGAPCKWGSSACSAECGKAVGSELILSDISVWQRDTSEAQLVR